MPEDNSQKIILDLCGGTGAWSKPYRDAGYDVRLITLPEHDVRDYYPVDKVHGILAAPPCTHFSNSGAQYWKVKDQDGRTLTDTQVLTHCLRIIAMATPVWWCMENPVGRFTQWMGKPVFKFDPCDFGDPYTKRTYLWGRFTIPAINRVEPIRVCEQGSWVQRLGGSSIKTKELRSATPQGFANAFFVANP